MTGRHQPGLPALPPLATALAALFERLEPTAPPGLLAATRLLVALEARGHTVLPLDDGGRAALAELGLAGTPWARTLPADSATARQAWAGSALVQIDPADDDGATPLVLQGTRLALRRHWRDERSAAARLRARLAALAAIDAPDEATLAPLLDALFPPRAAAPGPDPQRQAALAALRGRVALITGGPGTGKTWTAARLLVLLQALHPGPAPLRVALAAPTGKAAARLGQSISAALQQGAAGAPPALAAAQAAVAAMLQAQPARTLHATLALRPGARRMASDAEPSLPLDLLLVDEASMVHGEMLATLLRALPDAARLVLLGDRDQLSSVEAGAVMAELCEPGSPLAPQTVVLQAGHRFDGPIAELATAVNRGEAEAALALLAAAPPGLALLSAPGVAPLLALARGESGYGPFIARLRERPADPAAFEPWALAVLEAFEGFRLLAAVRDGPFGSVALNARLSEQLGPRGGRDTAHEAWTDGRPVMVTRNQPALGVANGDVGVALTPPGGGALRVWFRDGVVLRSVAASRLAAVETAWAMTVHKSQGSEFGHVALVLPGDDVPVLTRELVYTGITRARRQLTLVSPQPALLARALGRRTRRFSGLAAALRGE
jgi:exodeoxyribonuclease V alpha subunit